MKLYPRSRLRNMLSGGMNPYNRDLYATNGFQLTVTNANASVKWVEDKDGVLVQSPANKPAMPGMRLATTVAEGAQLGPELSTDGGFNDASKWGTAVGWTIDGGVATKVAGANNTEAQSGLAVVGKRYQIQFDIVSISGSGFRAYAGNSGPTVAVTGRYSAEVVASAVNVGVTATSTTVSGVIDNFSCREVIPTWLPTNTDGTLISPISRMLRTAQGSVAEYDETFPGVLVEPAATNYLLNTATPATQTTGSLAAGTYTLWIEGAGSAAVTAGTATISGNGTASAGSPNTFTVSVAGTVTVTVTDPVTFFQLEGGAFPTSKIPTTTAAVTRAADNVSFTTPAWLLAHPNDFAVIGTVIPSALQSTSGVYTLWSGINLTNAFQIYVTASGGSVAWSKPQTGISTPYLTRNYAHADGEPYQIIAYQSSIVGMGISVRYYRGGAWSTWSLWNEKNDADGRLNVKFGSTFSIGCRLSESYFYATYPMTRILRIPTNLSAAALQAWLVAKAGE